MSSETIYLLMLAFCFLALLYAAIKDFTNESD